MTVQFPTPSGPGDTYTYDAITYTWDGEKWVGSTASSFNDVTISGANANVILQGNDNITTDQTFTFPNTGGEIGTGPVGYANVGFQQGTLTVTSNATMNSQAAYWVRIGNWVRIQGACVFSGGQSSTDDLVMDGLPYSRQPNGAGSLGAANSVAGYICYASGSTARTVLFGAGNQYQFREGNNTFSMMSIAGLSASDTRWVLEYITDDTTWVPLSGATVS